MKSNIESYILLTKTAGTVLAVILNVRHTHGHAKQ